MKRILVAMALAGAYAAGRADVVHGLSQAIQLENSRVKVTTINYEPGKARERSVRAADQVIVFLNDSRYERIDPDTGEKTVRERKSGDVIWHNKGEVAPVLTNLGKKTYRTLVVELK